jgi:hypothetical protein
VTRIPQRGTNDCGVACVAMLAGKTYERAYQVLYPSGRPRRTNGPELITALIKLKARPHTARFQLLGRRRYQSLPSKALLKVNCVGTTDISGGWHWAVWTGERVIDPETPPRKWFRRATSYLLVK